MTFERNSRRILAVALVAGLAAAMAVAVAAQEKKSLYHRLGGYDALAAVTDDFIGRLVADPALNRFFDGHSKDSLGRIRQLIVDQLCAATGGPCIYIGRDMKTVHDGLGITGENWDTAVKHLRATLVKFNVAPALQDEVLAAIGGMKKDIVAPAG